MSDVYAQRVLANGRLGGFVSGVPAGEDLALHACPNPFNSSVTVNDNMPVTGPWRLVICDVSGRVLRAVDGAGVRGDPISFTWDGCDASGQSVASGNYMVRIDAGSRQATTRLTLIK